jgi:hypothetical protein
VRLGTHGSLATGLGRRQLCVFGAHLRGWAAWRRCGGKVATVNCQRFDMIES